MTDVLLVAPPMQSPAAQSSFNALCPPLGLGYLAACLLKEGISVEIADLSKQADPWAFLSRTIERTSPPFVGITCVTQNYALGLKAAGVVRAKAPGAFVAMGGPHTTYRYEDVLAEKTVDVVVRFEGEKSVVQLFHHVANKAPDLNLINGIAFRDGDRVLKTPHRKHEESLDDIPFPARHLMPMATYGRPGTIMTSRGCPYKCIFCISSTYEGNYRMRSPENVIAELVMLREIWGLREIYFIDNVFTASSERVQQICRQLVDLKLDIRFHCVCRLDLITHELVEMLKDAGCIGMEIGVESGDQEVINSMNKHISVSDVLRATDIVVGARIQPMFTFQIGSPFDRPESVAKTQALAAQVRAKGAIAFVSIMTPFPGTPLADRAQEFGIHIHDVPWSEYRTSNPITDTLHLKRQDFRRALYEEAIRSGVIY